MNDFFVLMKSELVLTGIIFLLLFIKIGKGMKNETLLSLIQVLLLANFIFGFFFFKNGRLFGDMFYTSPLIALQKNILNLGVYLISLVCADWLKKTEHLAEFFLLLLAALLGMFFMLSSANLLIFYLGLELASIPVAAMANFDLHKRASSEGAMKMILSSAFSSGLLLFGISLLYGATGTISLPELQYRISGSTLEILAFIFFFAAFAFKLSVVPFHLWTADVYEGSPVAVTGFLSVISKGAIAFIFMTMLFRVFKSLHETWFMMLVILSLVTLLIGNLFAIRQDSIKRFLAFSSIAQVGFILVAMLAEVPHQASTAVTYFVLVYIFSNLAAFGVASVIEEKTGVTTISGLKGLYKTNPFLSWMLALALFSLAGIPPTAGFFGKLFLITAGASGGWYWFIIIVSLNLIISLFYYLKVVRAVFMDSNDNPVAPIRLSAPVKLGLWICGAGIVLTGMLSWIYDYIHSL